MQSGITTGHTGYRATLQLHNQRLSARQLLRKPMYLVMEDLTVQLRLLLLEVLVDILTHGHHLVERQQQQLDVLQEHIP
jgi:hypothetical protein